MTHFSEAEFIDLLEGMLPPARMAHLQHCEACRGQSAAMNVVVARVTENGSGDVPEPSPLFWDHLSSRVSDAVAAPAGPAWRERGWWWPGTAWVAGLASVALAVAVSHAVLPRAPLVPPSAVAMRGTSAPADALPRTGEISTEPADDLEADEAWALVRSVADQIEWDEGRRRRHQRAPRRRRAHDPRVVHPRTVGAGPPAAARAATAGHVSAGWSERRPRVCASALAGPQEPLTAGMD